MYLYRHFIGIGLILISIHSHAERRIVGGERAKPDTWPWIVALVYSHLSAEDGQFCGGSLIHPQWVLTAGHCVEGETTETIEVVIGRLTLSRENRGDRIQVRTIIRHPDYDGSDFNYPPVADVALLYLERPSNQPILRIADQYSYLDQDSPGIQNSAVVMGWGSTTRYGYSGSYPDSLRQTTIPIVSNAICNHQQSYDGDIQETMLCAGFSDGGTDACIGDSGGPLVVNSAQGWQQIGIVSYGNGCARPNFYGVYTRLSAFYEFITQHTCQPKERPISPTIQIQVDPLFTQALWASVTQAQGYHLYYAPYSLPLSDITLNHIRSLDLGTDTEMVTTLKAGTALYVAVRAYQGNCQSDYSNLATVFSKPLSN